MNRCDWPGNDLLMIQYHDEEWGVPLHDDGRHFEFIVLDGMQAGLSWRTVLHKRENFRAAFDQFEVQKVAEYDEAKVAELLRNPGIIRNRQKIAAAIQNARAFLTIQAEFGSFDRYIWQFVGGKPRRNQWQTSAEIPAQSPEAEAMSQDLRQRGFSFVGPTICYAYMQAAGMVNDHLVGCFRYAAAIS
ncbi:MAG: DNA-3-methyladenine glycosylase I [Anaerolineae bacterium]|nr:DNA-3-methyladenine glycosylase I [Anaerolineae bacterium]